LKEGVLYRARFRLNTSSVVWEDVATPVLWLLQPAPISIIVVYCTQFVDPFELSCGKTDGRTDGPAAVSALEYVGTWVTSDLR